MKTFSDVILGSVADTRITLEDLLFHLKTMPNHPVLQEVVRAVLVQQMAAELGLSVGDEELQRRADDFRRTLGLISAQATQGWMKRQGLTVEDLERRLEQELLKDKVQQRLATDDAKKRFFAQNILAFERVKIAHILVMDAGLASEIKAQIEDGETEFCVAAARYSADKATAERGGFVGYVTRDQLPGELAPVVFADGASDIVGPVESQGKHHLVKILEAKRAAPEDPAIQAMCANAIFERAIAERARAAKPSFEFLQ